MNKRSAPKFLKSMARSVRKHSPEILIGLGVTGIFTTAVLAVKATPKALKQIDVVKKEEHKEKLTPVETIKATWKCYIPAATVGITSAACIIGANSVCLKRNAALATAYKLSESAFAEYKEKVIETVGEKKEQAIQDNVDKGRIEKNPVTNSEVYVTKKGNSLCFDYYSGRYFESDFDECKRAITAINSYLLRNDYVSLNDLYDELGLERNGVGDEMGWNVGRIGRDLIQPRISSQVAADGRPCLVLACNPAPQHDFDNYA